MRKSVAFITVLLVLFLGFVGLEPAHEHSGFSGEHCAACTARNTPVLENESYRFKQSLPVLSILFRPDRSCPSAGPPIGSFLSRAPPV